MKRILVPIDFSKEAENAARVAAHIARKTGSEIFLVHMLELPVTTIDPAEMNAISSEPQIIYFMKLAREKFQKFISYSVPASIAPLALASFVLRRNRPFSRLCVTRDVVKS